MCARWDERRQGTLQEAIRSTSTRDVSGIPIDRVITAAKDIKVKKCVTAKAASIEVLVVSKFRAAAKRKGTDDVDIRTLAQRR